MIPGAGHLPSFFVPTPGHSDSLCVSSGGGGGEGWALRLRELTFTAGIGVLKRYLQELGFSVQFVFFLYLFLVIKLEPL